MYKYKGLIVMNNIVENHLFRKIFLIFALMCAFLVNVQACTTILVGSKASADGSVIIARNDDHLAYIAQHVVVHPKRSYKVGSMFHSAANDFSYPMPLHALKYIAIPAAGTHDRSHEEAGLNALNIGVSATETIYNNQAVLHDDPYIMKTGINEDSIVSVLLPRIHSAREGVKLLGKIVETQGTDEGFGVAIADAHNIWYLETASGHQWVAMRIPDDECFVAANQSRIQQVNLQDKKNFLASPGLIQYAIHHHLYDPSKGPFNFRLAFSRINKNDLSYNYPRLAALFKMYNPNIAFNQVLGQFQTVFRPSHLLSVLDVMHGLQNHYQNTVHDPYARRNPSEPWRPISVFRAMDSHIIAIHANKPAAVAGVEYVALGMPSFSLYIPFFSGLQNVPAVYDLGNSQADDKSAFWTYRKMQTLTMLNYPLFAPMVHPVLARMQKKLIDQVQQTKSQYLLQPSEAMLQKFIQHDTRESLALVRHLNNRIMTQLTHNVQVKYMFQGA